QRGAPTERDDRATTIAANIARSLGGSASAALSQPYASITHSIPDMPTAVACRIRDRTSSSLGLVSRTPDRTLYPAKRPATEWEPPAATALAPGPASWHSS